MTRAEYVFVSAMCLAIAQVGADSIRVGGVQYENVYIGTSKQYYHVHFPEEGRVEKISRARRDVEEPKIDSDEAARDALKERFDAVLSAREKAREATPTTTVALDSEAYLAQKALASAALFDAQFSHWSTLSTEQQERILGDVLNLSATKAAKRHAERTTIQSRLEGLDAAKADREAQLVESQSKRDAAIQDAKRDSAAGIFTEEYEKSILRHQMGNSNYIHEHWREAAETEAEIEARRMSAANRAYGAEAGAHVAALNQVETAITQQERDAQAVENKARDAERRYGSFLARIDELILAVQAKYEPSIPFESVESWQGDGEKRTSVVAIESTLWKLECRRDDFGLDGKFSITVYDADTDTPFTRIADKDFLGMRTRIFDRPGQYYFVVEQDSSGIPYELTLSTLRDE